MNITTLLISFFAPNKPVQALSCIMGNQGKMVGNWKVCMGFQSQLILPGLIYLTLSLWKMLVMNSKKQYSKSGVHRSLWSVFRKLDFSHTFSVIRQYKNYRKYMGEIKFSKNWSWTSMHPRFSVLFLWIHKLHFSKRKCQMY